MVYDFEKITLSMKEKYKLFVTRMRKKSKAEYFGDSEYYLSDIKFIRQNSMVYYSNYWFRRKIITMRL